MTFVLRYTSSRSIIWRWYWRAWRRGLWRTHVGVASSVFVGVYVARAGASARLPVALIAAVLSVAWFPLYPLIVWKPEPRRVEIDERGVHAVRAAESLRWTWSEVALVEEHAGAVLVQGTNRNALIIPYSAFASDAERAQMIESVRSWRAEAKAAAFVA